MTIIFIKVSSYCTLINHEKELIEFEKNNLFMVLPGKLNLLFEKNDWGLLNAKVQVL